MKTSHIMFVYYVQLSNIQVMFKKCQNYIHYGPKIKQKILWGWKHLILFLRD